MVETSKSGSGEGPGKVTTRGYSTRGFRGHLSNLCETHSRPRNWDLVHVPVDVSS